MTLIALISQFISIGELLVHPTFFINPNVCLWPTMACIDAENLSLFIGDHLRLVIVWRLLRPE